MLVLGRGKGDRVFIDFCGVRVVVEVSEIHSLHRVKLGFDAPKEVKIMREELAEEDDKKSRKT